ncbi:phasin family protein [Litorisediminicola beolgyonensis]|uniref:Phasin family protein n=1 Tax=Litorisediminicola beolgyonensis TaxID=1173614 RepID=A0ABW3ZMA7_9RHOB
MPEKTTETTRKPAAKPTVDPTEMMSDAAALQAYGFNTVAGMSVAWAEALSEMGSEVLSFVAHRIKEDVKTQHQILHCRDVGELQKIQAEFLQTAIDQYRAETGKLFELSRDLLAPVEPGGDKS